MFIKNRVGASNTIEVVFIILIALIATIGGIYRLYQAMGNNYNAMANKL